MLGLLQTRLAEVEEKIFNFLIQKLQASAIDATNDCTSDPLS